MNQNRLKLNPSKTEFVFYGTKNSLAKCVNHSIKLSGSMVFRNEGAKYLGIWLDQNLSFKQQIIQTCAKAMLNLSRIRRIRRSLTTETCKIIVQALVISHLDYANGCYMGLPNKDVERLQNIAAKVVLQAGRMDSSKDCMRELYWLPIRERIHLKILTLVHSAVYESGPGYLKEMFTPLSLRSHRHGLDMLLTVPFTLKKTCADRSLSVAGPKLWNNVLSQDLRNTRDMDQFKTGLKTLLFRKAFA